MGGLMLGVGLGVAAVCHLWWRKSAPPTDAMDRPERAGA
jgi:hypothetical protein